MIRNLLAALLWASLASAGCDEAAEYAFDCALPINRYRVVVRNEGTAVAEIRVAWTWPCRGAEHELGYVAPDDQWSARFPCPCLDIRIIRVADGMTVFEERLGEEDFDPEEIPDEFQVTIHP